jgi:FKBP-type peptidyl-prolyl cis-trans isomerase FklB
MKCGIRKDTRKHQPYYLPAFLLADASPTLNLENCMSKWSLGVALLLAAVAVIPSIGQDGKDEPKAPALKTTKEKISYGIGLNFGRRLAQQKVDIDPAVLAKGIADALANRKPALTQEEIQEAFEEMEAQANAKAKLIGEKNRKDGVAYLATNGKKEGVKSTKSGLQYEVIRSGKGPTPKASDTVSTHYRGRLIDGAVFDSSYEGDEPAATDKPVSFPVNGVIKGWTEALQLMKVGDKWRLHIPSELAYGERGAGADIGPNCTLVFDIELLSVQSAKGENGK